MKKMRNRIFLIGAACLFLSSGAVAQQNYKIKQTTTIEGRKMESTIYVKGARKRTENGGYMGMGGDIANVEQCDLKRSLQISDKKKMYAVEPFDDGSGADTTPTATPVKSAKTKPQKGGTVTYVSNITDTGERKQMFGLTARHIKTSMTTQSSPDACSKENMKMETDGWYIDLPEFSCPMTARPPMPQMSYGDEGSGCRDRIAFKTTGGGKLGFPLTVTNKMTMGDDDTTMTTSIETLEFSKATLAAALFDIPAGYTETKNSQDLYGKPDMSQMMQNTGGNDEDEDTPKKPVKNNSSVSNSPPKAKKAGMIRIGVYMPTNKASENISTTNMQMFLIGKLTGGNIEAVAVSDEAGARSASCDYVLSSDFSKLKQSTASKIGGMFGKVTGTDTSSARNYDAQVEYKLTPLAGGKTVSSKASNKSESDVDRAAEAALSQEAGAILSAVKP